MIILEHNGAYKFNNSKIIWYELSSMFVCLRFETF